MHVQEFWPCIVVFPTWIKHNQSPKIIVKEVEYLFQYGDKKSLNKPLEGFDSLKSDTKIFITLSPAQHKNINMP